MAAAFDNNDGDFMAKVFKPPGYSIIKGVMDEIFTAEAVVDALSGDEAGNEGLYRPRR